MYPLAQAILDGNQLAVRQILRTMPEAARELSPSGRSMLQLARAKGSAQIELVLLYYRAPGSEDFSDHRRLLESLLLEISSDWMLARWYEGLEVIVWSLLVGDRASFTLGEEWGPFELSREEVAEWLFLAEAAGGWRTRSEFMPLDAWKKHYRSLDR